MTSKKSYWPGRGYRKQDWQTVSDNPEWTATDVEAAKPFAEAFPDLAQNIKRAARGRPALEKPRQWRA